MLALSGVPMLKGVRPVDLRALASLGRITEHEKADWLWQEGDEAGELSIILRGRVKVVRESPDGGTRILELFGPGEPVGALAMYNGIPYPAGAVCMEPVSLFRMARRDYFEMLERNPEMARGLIRDLTRIVITLTQKLEELRGTRVDARIARLLLMLSQRMGKREGDVMRLPVSLSRQEIADLVGTTVESAIRTLSKWGRQGIVRTQEGGFFIPSVEALEQVAAGSGEE